MSTTPGGKKLPPGRDGIPLLGETLSFAKDPFQFIEDRLTTHGRVFRSNVLGRKTVVIAGPEATGRFIDSNIVMRKGSIPGHIQELFGGRDIPVLDLIDDEFHSARKKVVLQAFTREALAYYLPMIQKSIEEKFTSWSEAGEIRWLAEMKRLSIEVICTTLIGMEPGEEMDKLRGDYDDVTKGYATVPINLPGTPYRKAFQARDRILDALRRCIRERHETPGDDGLSRMFAYALSSGLGFPDEDAALELHHLIVAGFIIYAELGAIVKQLTDHPEVRSKLAAEIASVAPSGALTLEQLMAMPYLMQVVKEVKRLCPIVPAVYGKARQEFEIDGVSVPAGWTVFWALRSTHVSESVYTDPEKFDPERFSPERAEDMRHEHAFVPQGAGPATGHRCPGLDYATYFMEVFAIVLLRDYTWQLPPQNFETARGTMPPEPTDALRAIVQHK